MTLQSVVNSLKNSLDSIKTSLVGKELQVDSLTLNQVDDRVKEIESGKECTVTISGFGSYDYSANGSYVTGTGKSHDIWIISKDHTMKYISLYSNGSNSQSNSHTVTVPKKYGIADKYCLCAIWNSTYWQKSGNRYINRYSYCYVDIKPGQTYSGGGSWSTSSTWPLTNMTQG